jgi:hypothetical protein
VKGLVVLTSP